MPRDYLSFYWIESHLFETVGPRFRESGRLAPVDFFLIVQWKSNRARRKMAKRLLDHRKTLEGAVSDLGRGIRRQSAPRDRLQYLMTEWGLHLPTASAILTVLYPDDFTVYDWRVRQQAGVEQSFAGRAFSDELWKHYCGFVDAVRRVAPVDLSLRDKDRWLWGKSYAEDLLRNIDSRFGA